MRRAIQLSILILVASLAKGSLQAEEIHWLSNVEQAKQIAAQSNRLVLIHFWSHTCAPCLQLDANVYNSPGIGPQIEASYVPVKVNAAEHREVASLYGITKVPTDVIIAADGSVVSAGTCPPTRIEYLKGLVQIAAVHAAGRGAGPGGFVTNQAGAMGVTVAGAAHVSARKQIEGAGRRVADAGSSLGDRYKDIADLPPQGQALVDQFQQPPIQQPIQSPLNQQPIQSPRVQQPPVQQPPVQQPLGQQPLGQSRPPVQQPPVQQTQPSAGDGRLYEPPMNAAGPGKPSPPAKGGEVDSRRISADLPLWPRKPAAEPLVGLDGTCPVELVENERWVPGDRRWGAVHRGTVYLFAKEEHQKRFMANPDYYSPALAGNDPVLAIEQNQLVPGYRKHGLFYEKRVFLFSSEETLAQFFKNPLRYLDGIQQHEAKRGK